MTKSNIVFIGMDVHKESIEIALADDGAHERLTAPAVHYSPLSKH